MKDVTPYGRRQQPRRARAFRPAPHNLIWLVIVAAGFALVWATTDGPILALPKLGSPSTGSASFAMCGAFSRSNCVIDGDTFQYQGVRIRVADIDAPETHPPRCDLEARLGDRATRRLLELLNDGPFILRQADRDEDDYGRKLRTVVRDGRSIGGILVSEGLARRWTGRRMPWCA